MCSPPFQAQISMTFEHETLSLYKQSRLWLRRSVNAVSPYNSSNYDSHRFSTYTKGLKELLQWLLAHNCKDVCMESTGKYWIRFLKIRWILPLILNL